MKFDSIGDFSGVATVSQNKRFTLIHSSIGSDKPSSIMVSKAQTKEHIYAYRLPYASDTAISNQGHVAAISRDYETMEATITCIDSEGTLVFTKRSGSQPICLAFDNDCKNLVVSFAGEETFIECYSIIWLDIHTGLLMKAQLAPDMKPPLSMSFDSENKLVIKI